MNRHKKYIVLDLGGSGRCIVGNFDGETLGLKVVSRFENSYVRVLEQVYWNALGLFGGIKQSLRQVGHADGSSELASIGVDTMGVSFALLDRRGELVSNLHYSRIPQEQAILAEAFRRLPPAEIYHHTGLQLTKLNSLYYLVAMQQAASPLLDVAHTFLMYPDLINYWLTGRIASEYTIASTSHLLDARARNWATPLIKAMGLPGHIFPEIVAPGQVLASLHPAVRRETGLPALPVVATACHDTAAAVAAIPATQPNFAYLSSGTWGLLGAEVPQPILTDQARDYNFANEGGVNGIRFIKNNVNLWLLQECRRVWAGQGQNYGWAELVSLAEQSEPFLACVDPNAPDFLVPVDMPQAIRQFCRQTGQAVPQTPGQIVRVILESLAFKYRESVDKLAEIRGQKPEVLHILGGGGRNRLLSQFAANATGLPVITGPFEATAAGNIMMQMIALGDLANVAEGRALIRRSFPTETYSSQNTARWQEKYQQYLIVTPIN